MPTASTRRSRAARRWPARSTAVAGDCDLAVADAAALLRPVRRAPSGSVTLYSPGRQPVDRGHRQGQRHPQLPSGHRAHRPARHGAVLAHRPAQRHGRARGRRARQSAGRAHGFRRPRTSIACAASGTRPAWRPGRASRRSTCSRRWPTGASRRCGSWPPIRPSACRAAERVREALRALPASSSSPTRGATDTTALRPCGAAGRGLGREGRHGHQFRALHLAPAARSAPRPARPGRTGGCSREVARRMGWARDFAYAGPADIFREHAALSAFENDGARDVRYRRPRRHRPSRL